MKDVEFTIKVKMEERWVDDFCSLLRYMEWCGNVGHSALIGFYADGDGDFRPKFHMGIDYKEKKGIPTEKKTEVLFDAG